MVKIKHISMDNPLYEQEKALRVAILLEPIGYSFEDYLAMAPGREAQSEHFVAVVDHPSGERVVGTATLFIREDEHKQKIGKVQQVCVDKQRQGEGIGRKLMIAMEARGFGELGLTNLYCHAQLMPCLSMSVLVGRVRNASSLRRASRTRKCLLPRPSPPKPSTEQVFRRDRGVF